MPLYCASVDVTQNVTLKVSIEAESEAEALAMINDEEFDDVIDETDQTIVSINRVEFY